MTYNTTFAGVDPDALLTTADAADILQVSFRSLQQWRWQGTGPRYIRVARNRVRYHKADLLEWVQSRSTHPVGEGA